MVVDCCYGDISWYMILENIIKIVFECVYVEIEIDQFVREKFFFLFWEV